LTLLKQSISNTQQGISNDEGKQMTQQRIGNTWMLGVPCWILDVHVVSSWILESCFFQDDTGCVSS
jgi:hypothetical protein